MHKKAQLSVFIIVGIVVLLAFSVFLIEKRNGYFTSLLQDTDATNRVTMVRQLLEECVTGELGTLLTVVALHGGYASVPPYSLPINDSVVLTVPYYLYDGAMVAITKSDIETGLATALDSVVTQCIGSVSLPPDVSLTPSQIPPKVTMNPELILITLTPPEVNTPDAHTNLGTMELSYDVPLGTLSQAAREWTTMQRAEGDAFCLSCLKRFSESHHLDSAVREIELPDGIALQYTFRTLANNLTFNFAHKLPLPNSTSALHIYTIPDAVAHVGETLTIRVQANHENVLFSDTSPLFSIDPYSGVITFIPTPNDVGEHLVTVVVRNPQGDRDEQTFTVMVDA